MGKLLRVLTVILFILTIGALTMGILLFNRREILKGRTQKLERTLIMLGPTIEAEGAALDETKPDYPARDIDDTTSLARFVQRMHQLQCAEIVPGT